jgi:hypothetical protein
VPTRRELFEALAALAVIPATVTGRLSDAGQAAIGGPADTPLVNLFDYEELARKRLPAMAYEYIAGGAGDEVTLRDTGRTSTQSG